MNLTKTEIQWVISALNHTADDCNQEASGLSGTLKGIALQAEYNYRSTATKLVSVLESGAKRIEIK